MRRFAALFKRNDKSDPRIAPSASDDARSNPPSKSTTLKKRSLFFRSLSAKAVQPPVIREPTHPVPQRPPQAHSSSSSSTDSPAPATPDDDSEIGPGPPYRRSNQWSERKLALPLPAAGGSLGWDPPRSRSLGIPQIPSIARSSESDDLDDESSATSSSPSVPSPLSISPHTSLYTFTTYALAPTFSAPPLLYLPDIPLFPRSVNSVSSLSHQDTMASTLHRNQILRRLARRDLTASEERSVASFTSPRPLPAKSPFFLSKFDGGPTCNVRRVSNVSQGLKRWVSRPCFEDRMSVYTLGPSGRPDDIVVHNVSGSALGVEALEVSEAIDVLAGYNVEERSETLWLPMLSSPSTTDLRLSAPAPTTSSALAALSRNQSCKATPSPLRTETIPPSPDQTKVLKPTQPSLQSSLAPLSPSLTSPLNVNTRAKRVRSSVRFDVEEKRDKDEHVPLGQIMRIKRGREERAKFLELEKERRTLEEERLKHETEKRRWEQEKKAWENERKAVEEEKKKRLYQQEVIAARKRRESQVFKTGPSPTDSPETEPQSNRRQGSYSRPAYDSPQRQSLDESLPAAPHPPPRNESFNSSRGSSRPQSLHSAPSHSTKSSHMVLSTEDAIGIRGRRASMLPQTPPQLPMMMQPYGYPWGIPVMPQMPMQMAPQVPYYSMDNMPLLPPAAPFMMQQAGDRKRSISNSLSRSSPSLGKSAGQSTDRLSLNQGASPVRRSTGHKRSSSGGSSPNQFGNGQQSNQGSVSSSRRSSGIVNDPSQWRNSTRQRPPMPQNNSQGPGSWVVPSSAPQRPKNTVS